MSKRKQNDVLQSIEDNCMQMGDKAHKEYMSKGNLPTGKFAIASYRNAIAVQALKIKKGKL